MKTNRSFERVPESAIVDEGTDEMGILDERAKRIVSKLMKFEKVPVGKVCGQ